MKHGSSQPFRLRARMWLMLVVTALTVLAAGCRSDGPCCDPGLLSRELSWRIGSAPQPVAPSRQVIPPGVVVEDGLSEDEAIRTALTNNSAFQAAQAQLQMAGGDAVQADLIANPQLLVYFPTAAKEGQYTLYAPIESYFLRPARVKVANREYRRIGQQLVQNGLDLARDVRLAYTDLAIATQQAELAHEALQIRRDIERLTEKRLQDGAISELETIAAHVDQLNARATAGVQTQAIGIAEARLAALMGLTTNPSPLIPLALETPVMPVLSEQELVQQALGCRPDYQAACWTIAAAAERSRLARWMFLRLDGVLDVRDGPGYTRTGGGLRMDLPIFNRNEGGIIRADWEVNAACHARDAIHDQIVADVRTAFRQLQQASDNLRILEQEVLPAIADALQIAKKGFADGGTDYLLVLQTTTQYLDVRARILDQKAAYARALAQLERSVGCHLEAGLVDVEQLNQAIDVPMPDVEPAIEPAIEPAVEDVELEHNEKAPADSVPSSARE
ncbi:MAG: TolC family protein [Planctomycetaceae bacterium]